jgi:predicted metal-dependent phosphotriesterase family hydrolase
MIRILMDQVGVSAENIQQWLIKNPARLLATSRNEVHESQ